MTGGIIFSADIAPEMLNLCSVTKVKVFFLVLVYVFNFDLFEFSAAILEKRVYWVSSPRSPLGILIGKTTTAKHSPWIWPLHASKLSLTLLFQWTATSLSLIG